MNSRKTPISNDREAVRLRPGMYVGGINRIAMHHLIFEVMDHMIDEALLGQCNHIRLELHDNQHVILSDNSDGIPVNTVTINERCKSDKQVQTTTLEALCERLHITKTVYDPTADSQPKVASIFHGIGLSVVNFLSESFTIESTYQGTTWCKTYRHGEAHNILKSSQTQRGDGLNIQFRPDFTVLEENDFDRSFLVRRCKDVAAHLTDITITLIDQRNGQNYCREFHYADGLRPYVAEINAEKNSLHDIVHLSKAVKLEPYDHPITLDICFQFTDDSQSDVRPYCNTVITRDGGTHLEGFQEALLTVLNTHTHIPFTWEQIKPGLTAVVSVQHPNPQFLGRVKVHLDNPELHTMVIEVFDEHFEHAYFGGIERVIAHLEAQRTLRA